MSEFSWRDIFCLYCCPPCPSKIAAKIAFWPPEPTYSFSNEVSSNCEIKWNENLGRMLTEKDKENTEGFFVRTSRRNKIACLFIKCTPNPKFNILFSHGNAVDLGHICNFLFILGRRLNCNVFSYDYSGYGASSGKPSERNIYADIESIWNSLRGKYGINPENIILYGDSIGTAPTVHLASKYEVGAVILHSSFTSGLRIMFPNVKRTWCFDAFPIIDKVCKITAPVLVIHGTEDDIVDFCHGVMIYSKCPCVVEPLWVVGAGHNNIEKYEEYFQRLERFISFDLVKLFLSSG